MDQMRNFGDSTLCEHFFEDPSRYFGAVVPPIVPATLFTFPTYGDFLEASKDDRHNYTYTRGNNPTMEMLEKKLAALERGEGAKVFSTGMGAISATLFTLLKSGDHILLVNNVYGPATRYIKQLEKFGIENTNIFVDAAADMEEHLRDNTRVIYFESPSTQMMRVIDLEVVAAIGKKHDITTIIDNTWATPLHQKPLEHGIDLSIHSCTKFIGGHSDAMGGCVIGAETTVRDIFDVGHQFQGAVLGPFEAWLITRGLRTLAARLEYSSRTVEKLVHMLQDHKAVRKVNHPFCYEGEQKTLAEKYLTGYSSLLSIELDTEDLERIGRVADACRIFQIGVSWGGHESLILPQYNGRNEKYLNSVHIPKGLVRIYVGLENADNLLDDLKTALDQHF